jgi:hypothetical protein
MGRTTSSDIWHVHIDPPAPKEFDTVTTLAPLLRDPDYGKRAALRLGEWMQTLVPGDSGSVL